MAGSGGGRTGTAGDFECAGVRASLTLERFATVKSEVGELAPYEHVVFTEFDGGDGILVDLNAKKYFQMNPTATLVWRALAAGRVREEIIDEMISEYEVGNEQAAQSIERLLAHLQDFNLIGPRAQA